MLMLISILARVPRFYKSYRGSGGDDDGAASTGTYVSMRWNISTL